MSDAGVATKVSHWPMPTGRLVLLLVAVTPIVLLFPRQPWIVLVIDAIILLIAWIDFLVSRGARLIDITRSYDGAISLDRTAPITWTVKNGLGRNVRLRFRDSVAGSLGIDKTEFQSRFKSKESKRFESTIRPTRRGEFALQEVTVRMYGPLGLSIRQFRRSVVDNLKVYPSVASRREAQLRIENTLLDEGARSVRSRGGGTDFDQLREYGPDDDFRFIDWAATARSTKPIVRTYRADRNQEVVVLLDTGRSMASQIQGQSRLDHAFDATFALSTIAGHLGDRVSLLAFDDRVRVEVLGKSGKRQTDGLVEAVFQLEPRLVESDYRAAFVHTLMRHRRRALVVLITDLGVQSASGALPDVLPLLLRTHKVIVAGVGDPRVEEWANGLPVETNKAFRKASAIQALDDRRRFKAMLTSRGVKVVDREPKKLTNAVVDAYLDIKAAGSL